MKSMKSHFTLAVLVSAFAFGCSSGSSTNESDLVDTRYMNNDDSLATAKAYQDSVTSANKATEDVAYGKAKFGMSERQYRKAIPNFTNDIVGVTYMFKPEYNKAGKLYRLWIDGNSENASYLDNKIMGQTENLISVISKKYGEPLFRNEYPKIFDYSPNQVNWICGWQIGDKSIRVGIAQGSTPRYYASALIASDKMTEQMAGATNAQVEKQKEKDANNF